MNLFDDAYIELWSSLNDFNVRYIMVGGFATNFHGFQRFTGDVDIFLDDTPDNRKKFRQAYKAYGIGDFASIETMQFVPGWTDFPLKDGTRLDIMTMLKGVEASFEECLKIAPTISIRGLKIPYLHINHLIANKKAVSRPKDQIDLIELEKIRKLQEENNPNQKET